MAYAKASDVNERLVGRDLDDEESVIVETRLDDAEELIRLRVPDIDDKVASGEIRERLVVMVEAEAVLRLIRNPDGYSQETDGNYSYSISAAVASGRLEIRPEEWRLLGVRSSIALVANHIMLPRPSDLVRNPNNDFESGLPWQAGFPDTAVWG